MISLMARAGILVRISIILVDFREGRLTLSCSHVAACLESGAGRFRPMLLHALAAVGGGLAILPNPIFQGLAIALVFGAIASFLTSPLALPLIYSMTHAGHAPAVATAALGPQRLKHRSLTHAGHAPAVATAAPDATSDVTP